MLVFRLKITHCLIVMALATGLMAYEFPQKDELLDFSSQVTCPLEVEARLAQNKNATGRDTYSKDISVSCEIKAPIPDIVQAAEKALVFVTVTRMVAPKADLFEHFFGRRHPPRQEQQKRISAASGFFVDLDNGYIVTNAHVVKDSKGIKLTLGNGEEYEGIVTGADENTDIAIIQVKDFKREGLDWLELTSTDNLRTGDQVIALGAPFGFKASASLGIVSGLQRGNLGGLTALGNFIQTDAAINPGNSGGPLLNMRGQVVGVNSAIYSVSGGYNGLGFAVPSEIVKKVAYQLIEKGKFERGYLGIIMQELKKELRDSFKMQESEGGVIVAQVAETGPAAQAGLQVGDVILAIDGTKVSTPFELANAVGFNPPGTVVEVTYLRKGERLTIEVELSTAPNLLGQTSASTKLWGLQLEEVKSSNRYRGGAERGIVVLNSENIKSDVQRGDVIVAVDNLEVQGLAWFEDYLKNKKEVVLYLNRNGQYLFVTLHQQ